MSAGLALGLSSRRIGRTRVDPVLSVSGAVCVLLVLVAVCAPLIAPYSPQATDILSHNQPASAAHLFGTDSLGRDIFSRVVWGAQLSLLGPAIVVVLSVAIGTALALSAAWFGGWWDAIVSRVFDILFAFPGLLFAVLAVSIFGPGLLAPIIALTVAYVPYVGRLIRVIAVRERALPYIAASGMSGFSSWRITIRHLLPSLFPMIRAQATIEFGSALVDLAAISFIGLGVQAPTAEWGVMVSEGRTSLLNGYPNEALAAGALILITVVAFNVFGERLSQRSEALK